MQADHGTEHMLSWGECIGTRTGVESSSANYYWWLKPVKQNAVHMCSAVSPSDIKSIPKIWSALDLTGDSVILYCTLDKNVFPISFIPVFYDHVYHIALFTVEVIT